MILATERLSCEGVAMSPLKWRRDLPQERPAGSGPSRVGQRASRQATRAPAKMTRRAFLDSAVLPS